MEDKKEDKMEDKKEEKKEDKKEDKMADKKEDKMQDKKEDKKEDKMQDLEAPQAIIPLKNFPTPDSNKKPINYKDYFNYIQGDITTMKADIIVNSSTSSMEPLTGVSKSIHIKCGSSLLKYLKKNYYAILPGSFVESPNFKLKCKVILHVCGPNKEDEQLLYTIYEQCLNYCFNHNYHSIIFPCISTGGRHFEEGRACYIAVNTCKTWIEKYHNYWKGNITFCCFTNESLDLYKKAFKDLLNL